MLCEHWKENDSNISPKGFKLYHEKFNISMSRRVDNRSVPLKGLKMTHIPVHLNITTTG